VTLVNCEVFRVWRNQTRPPQNKDRTVSVAPTSGTIPQPPQGTCTVFVAIDNFNQAPAAQQFPTTVGPDGDSVCKTVPPGEAVFVHYAKGQGGPNQIKVNISEDP
jgi:hypothetical protein